MRWDISSITIEFASLEAGSDLLENERWGPLAEDRWRTDEKRLSLVHHLVRYYLGRRLRMTGWRGIWA